MTSKVAVLGAGAWGTALASLLADRDDGDVVLWSRRRDLCEALNATRARGKRIVSVGTTSARILESASDEHGNMRPFEGETAIFITPGYRFRAVDALMTNFHLPRSTLFMLACAFAGPNTMRAAYAHAIEAGYRFYSYGDACLLTGVALASEAGARP